MRMITIALVAVVASLLPWGLDAAEAPCATANYTDKCFESTSVLDATMESAFCHDTLSCQTYENLYKAMATVTDLYYGSDPLGACVVDVPGNKLASEQYTMDHACANFPTVESNKFRVFAASFPIDSALQNSLAGMNMWKQTGATVSTSFCMTIGTSCTDLAFGVTGNADTVTALEQMTSASEPLVENIVTLLREQIKMGLDEATIAIATPGSLSLLLTTYSPRLDFESLSMSVNFMMDYSGSVDLPFLDLEKFGVVSITGKFSRSYDFESHAHAVLNQFSLHPITLDAAFLILSEYPEALSISGPMTVGFSDLSGGLLPDLSMSLTANAYKVPMSRPGWKTGFYMSGKTSSKTELTTFANGLCTKFEGALLSIASISCPDLAVAENAEVGVFIQEQEAGFFVASTPLDIECRILMMDSPRPALNCRFGSNIFQLVQDSSGFIVNKVGDIGALVGGKVGATSLRIAHSTYNAFGGINEDAGKVALQLGDAAKKFGFAEKKQCKGTTEVLWSTNDPKFDRFFFQYGQGDTLGHCFNSCAENYLAYHKGKTDPCCEYEDKEGDHVCRLGFSSSEDTTDESKFASIAFVADFAGLSTKKEVGGECEASSDCLSGFCFQKKCFKICTTTDPCFPGPFSACGRDDNACINVGGLSHYCDAGVCVADPLTYNKQVRFRLDHETYFVDIEEKFYTGKPAVFASLMSMEGGETATLRVSGVTNDSFDVNVQEETSRDMEIKHAPEAIGYVTFEAGLVKADGMIIGEVGRIAVNQDSGDKWFKMDDFMATYNRPLVFMMVNTFHDSEPCHMRIRNVESDSFEYQLEEWEYLDGAHAQEDVVYLIIEEGTYMMDDGMVLQAFSTQFDYRIKKISFPQAHTEVPVVVGQVQTTNDPAAVTIRMRNAKYDEIQVRLQEEEKKNGKHGEETVAILVYGSIGAAKDGKSYDIMPFAVDHDLKSVFISKQKSVPAVFASMLSRKSGDTADTRVSSVSTRSFFVKILEEQSKDSELNHAKETLGYVAMPDGVLYADGVAVGEVGRVSVTQNSASTWFKVNTFVKGSYNKPIVFMDLNTVNDNEPCHIRLKDVKSNEFQYKIEEWSYLDGKHPEETAVYMIIEEGIHDLDNGMTIQAFKTEMNWQTKTVFYPVGHKEDPIVFSQTQSYRDQTPVNTRMRDVSNTKFKVLLDEEEKEERKHNDEVVGFITYGIRDKTESGNLYAVIPSAVDHNQRSVELGNTSFDTPPAIFADMMSVASWDTASLRISAVTTSRFFVSVQEEQSKDSETTHSSATLGYAAFADGAIKSNGKVVAEVGRLTVKQNNKNNWFTFDTFLGEYVDPIVIMMMNTFNDLEPCHIRLRNVESASFQYKVEEWDYLDGSHEEEEVVYMIVEMGAHRLDNGMTLQAFHSSINKDFRTVEYPIEYNDVPVIISQTQTVNEESAVVTRVRNADDKSCQVMVDEEENKDGVVAEELVGIVAYGVQKNDATSRMAGDDEISNYVVWESINHNLKYIDMEENFLNEKPAVFGSIMSVRNWDAADLRVSSVTSGSFFAMIQEETSKDSETSVGSRETIGFIPMVDGTIVVGGVVVGEVGRMTVTQDSENNWFTVDEFEGTYESPVVIAMMNTFNDVTPAHTRIRNVKKDSFQFQLEEWDATDGKHGEEEVVYMVLEQGTHLLPNGLTLQAFKDDLNKDWADVTFPRNHTEIPVVIAQTQTVVDATAVNVRVHDITKTGFKALLREQETNTNDHTWETVAYVTYGAAQEVPTFQIREDDDDENKQVIPYALSHQTIEVDLPDGDFDAKPAVFASTLTITSWDPIDVRINAVTKDSFFIRVQEDRSKDSETSHNKETFSYLALPDGEIKSKEGNTIGIVGRVSVKQNNRNQWHTLGGFGTYTTPIVIMMLNTFNGMEPCHIRLDQVKATSFKYKIEEWDYLDGEHTEEEAVYMVVEEGTHELENGFILQAYRGMRDYNEKLVDYPRAHGKVPVILSQTQTVADEAAVVTRMRDVSATGVDIRLQEQENNSQDHGLEAVGVITYGHKGDHQATQEGANENVIPLNENVLHNAVDHQVSAVDFIGNFTTPPAVFASITSVNDWDTATVRLSAVTTKSFFVSVQEEQSKDSETEHREETISYVAFNDGVVKNSEGKAIGEVGRMNIKQNNANQWFTKDDLEVKYGSPVVFMVINTFNGWEPCHMRVRNVDHDGFQYQLEEWDYLDGAHETELVAYLVFEEGVHELDNGMVLQGFRVRQDHSEQTIEFPTVHSEIPVVISQTQTENGDTAVNTRIREVGIDKFKLRIQEQQESDQRVSTEIVAIMTYGRIPDVAPAAGTEVEKLTLPHAVGHDTVYVRLPDLYPEIPAVFADMMTAQSWDAADVRVSAVTNSSFFVKVQEETTQDSELWHNKETIGFIVLPDGPIFAGQKQIGEVGRVSFKQNNKNQWRTITDFTGTYVNPVVLMTLNTNTDIEPGHIRLRDVKSDSFQYQLEEWGNQDGSHGTETAVYMIVEEGTHQLRNGMTLQAFRQLVGCDSRDLYYPRAHMSAPVVIGQTQSRNHEDALTTRIYVVQNNMLKIRLQEEDSKDDKCAVEQVGIFSYGEAFQVQPFQFPEANSNRNDLVLPRAVSDHTVSIDLREYDSSETPAIFFFFLSKYDGSPADVRISTVTDSSFFVSIQEEQSKDSEMDHAAEDIGFLYFKDGVIRDVYNNPIGEVGRVSVRQNNKDNWFRLVDLKVNYKSRPIVVMMLNTNNDLDPAHMRVRSVTKTYFEYKVEEWDYQDGKHDEETAVYMVVEEGVWQMPDGTTLQAFFTEANDDDVEVNFPRENTEIPVVLSQSQTTYAPEAIVTRMNSIDLKKFKVELQEQEVNEQDTNVEKIGVLALGASVAVQPFQATPVAPQVYQQAVRQHALSVDIDGSFDAPPAIFANMMSIRDGDPSDLRVSAVTPRNFLVRVQEEKSKDSEISHNWEDFGYMAFEDGIITDAYGRDVGEVGRIAFDQNNGNSWFTMNNFLKGEYNTTPVVIMMLNSNNDASPVHIRLRSITQSSFQYKMEEWDYQDSKHGEETAVYMILEEGVHTMPNNLTLQAFFTETNDDQTEVYFPFRNEEVPVVVSQTQTFQATEAVVTRMTSITVEKLRIEIQEQELNIQETVYEKIGVVSYGKTVDVQPFKMNLLENAFPQVYKQAVREHSLAVDIDGTFDAAPAVFANMMSTRDGDPSSLRIGAVTTRNFFVRVEEEQSHDTETTHNWEDFGYLALPDGLVRDRNDRVIGEVGRVTFKQNNKDQWRTMNNYLKGEYSTKPVVIMMVNSNNDVAPVHMRLKDVTPTSFKYQMEEWDYQDGTHEEETVVYMILEEGVHDMAGDVTLQAFFSEVDDNQIEVYFPRLGSEIPVVLSQAQTATAPEAIVTRMNDFKVDRFKLELVEQQKNGQDITTELVGIVSYGRTVAVQPFQETTSSTLYPQVYSQAVRHQSLEVDIDDTFDSPPAIFANMLSTRDGDVAALRIGAVTSEDFLVRVEEEKSKDSSISHNWEDFGYLAMPDGPIKDVNDNIVGEVGRVTRSQNNKNQWFTVNNFVKGSYSDPLVVMMLNSDVDKDPAFVRLKDVGSSSFKWQIQEWDYMDGQHGTETVVYMIVENGVHDMGNGVFLQGTSGSVSHSLNYIYYPQVYTKTPVVLSQSQTVNEADAIVTRMREASTTRVRVQLQEQEANSQNHASEKVAVISFGV